MNRTISFFLLALLIFLIAYSVFFELLASVAKRYTPLAPAGTAAWYEMRSEMSEAILPYRITQILIPIFVFTVLGLIASSRARLDGESRGRRLLILAVFVISPVVLLVIAFLAIG